MVTTNFEKLLGLAGSIMDDDELDAEKIVSFDSALADATGADIRIVKAVLYSFLEHGLKKLEETDENTFSFYARVGEITRVKILITVCNEHV